MYIPIVDDSLSISNHFPKEKNTLAHTQGWSVISSRYKRKYILVFPWHCSARPSSHCCSRVHMRWYARNAVSNSMLRRWFDFGIKIKRPYNCAYVDAAAAVMRVYYTYTLYTPSPLHDFVPLIPTTGQVASNAIVYRVRAVGRDGCSDYYSGRTGWSASKRFFSSRNVFIWGVFFTCMKLGAYVVIGFFRFTDEDKNRSF